MLNRYKVALCALMGSVLTLGAAPPASAQAGPSGGADSGDMTPSRRQAEAMIAKAIAYLRTQQDKATGGWSMPKPGTAAPQLPAVSGLVLNGLLMQPGLDEKDATVAAAGKYILSMAKPDGGIYDAILPTYNTAICLSALAKLNTPEARAAIGPAQEFLKRSQWGTADPVGVGGAGGKEAPPVVDQSNAFYGGIGYGNRGRPDISNLGFAIQAWHDSGLPIDDPAFQRAIVFLQRCQMLEKDSTGKVVNDQPYAKGTRQGGFIYATGEDAKTAGAGQSFAGSFEETLDDGTRVSRLRAYGSVTYLGFKSYLYAGLSKTDPRVTAAMDWIGRNYSMCENPYMGGDGYYYYLVMLARAMQASELESLAVSDLAPLHSSVMVSGLGGAPTEAAVAEAFGKHGKVNAVVMQAGGGRALVYFSKPEEAKAAAEAMRGAKIGEATIATSRQVGAAPGTAARDWRADVVSALSLLQNSDGSFRAIDDRWMENNPVLVTAYALLALQSAVR